MRSGAGRNDADDAGRFGGRFIIIGNLRPRGGRVQEDGHLVDALSGMYAGTRNGDYEQTSDDFAKVVGRKPQTTEDFLHQALTNQA